MLRTSRLAAFALEASVTLKSSSYAAIRRTRPQRHVLADTKVKFTHNPTRTSLLMLPRYALQPSHLQVRAYTLKFSRSASAAAAIKSQTGDLWAETHKPPEPQPIQRPPISNADERKVTVGWSPSMWSRFHNIWLRDHCRCPQCFHQVTKQRLVNTFDILPDVKPSHVESTQEGLKVIWPSSPPHVSVYPWHWLKRNSYDPVIPNAQPESTEKVLWGAKIAQDPPTVTYESVMSDEQSQLKWLQKIDTFGFCFVSGVPPTAEDTEELSRKLGNIRETQYGKFWDFTSDLAKGDTAYTSMALQAHTDTTYFTDPSGLQLFHLLSHTEGTGGASLLVDGFYVASILKELHPDAYALLSSVRVPTHAAGEAGALFRPRVDFPILNHDSAKGTLTQVRYNNDDRSALNGIGADAVENWYHALRLWNKFLTSPDSEYWVQLTPGTAVVIDNHRVLHGRSAFDGKRRMCGAYIGIDDYNSKLAVLSEKYGDVPGPYVNGRSIWSHSF